VLLLYFSTTLIDSCWSDAERSNSTQRVHLTEPAFHSIVAGTAPQEISSQLDLFWGRNPGGIVGAIQFLHFGYAMLLSYLYSYWGDIIQHTSYYWVAVVMIIICLVCFAISESLMTRIVPRFILCTNIGELVNSNKLRETLAKHRLEEAIAKKRTNALPQNGDLDELVTNHHVIAPDSLQTEVLNEESPQGLENMVAAPTEKDFHFNKGISTNNESQQAPALQRDSNEADVPHSEIIAQESGVIIQARSVRERPRNKSLSEGVSTMRFQEKEKCSKIKSLSDGVASMRLEKPADQTEVSGGSAIARLKRSRSRRKKSASEGIRAMQLRSLDKAEASSFDEDAHFGMLAELVSMSTKDLLKVRSETSLRTVDNDVTDSKECSLGVIAGNATHTIGKISRRQQRKKSYSEGVASMRNFSVFEKFPPHECDTVAEEVDANTKNKIRHLSSNLDVLSPLSPTTSNITCSKIGRLNIESCENQKPAFIKAFLDPLDDVQAGGLNILEIGDSVKCQRQQKAGSITPTISQLDNACLEEHKMAFHEHSDVKEAMEVFESHSQQDYSSIVKVPKMEHVHLIFTSTSFKTINLFVTMACFFLVALRMEILLVESDVIKGDSWFNLNSSAIFWAEVSFLMVVILEGLLRLYSFAPHRTTPGEISMCFVGVCGCIIGGVCMSLLLVSEALRPSTYGSFGSRASAGMGKIEPFTILIFLRFFYVPFGQHM